MTSDPAHNREIRAAFQEYDRNETITNFKVACVLGMLLMPAGFVLDSYVYGDQAVEFLKLRFLCSLLIGAFLGILVTSFGRKHYRFLGVTLFMLPASFMAWMIYVTEGAISPYYAGLNLVLLTLAFVLHWTFRESLTAAALVIGVYIAACAFHGPLRGIDPGTGKGIAGQFINNLYFLGLTGIIVATGSYFHSKSRFREFAFRFELDRSRLALEESNQKLKELDEIKSRFFANISHELRTPLTLLIAPLEALIQRFRLDPQTNELLATMQSNGMRLLKLINDLLDLVRLQSGVMQVRREPVDIAEFAKAITSAARQVADDRRLRLETFVDPALGTALADRDKLEKIALNLVFNALKFTPSGGRVELRAEKRGDKFLLIVADTGMGIAEKDLPNVFGRFWQADGSAKRKYQGMGIGLALVKELAQIQGGEASVKSQEGQGTTFTVELPYEKAEAGQPAASTPGVPAPAPAGTGGATVTSEEWLANLYRRAEMFPALTPLQETLRPVEASANGNRPRVLVADDEPDMLRFLKSQLASHYQVIEAVDGQQAVDKAGQFLPDLILLDMMMPEKDGLQACREIRAHTPTHSIPVVLLTARADEETKMAALSAGASDFLTKPFSSTELHVRIRNLIESFDYQRKLSKQNQALESTIEQLKETETQLVQSEKLASLGRMSAGIIHEINNPLNFATTGLFTLRNKGKHLAAEQQSEYLEVLKDVEDGLKRVRTIVSDLRMFTHPDTESRDQVELEEVVAAALRFLSSEVKDKVRVEQKLEANHPVWANKNKLIHVVTNLLQNSIDALKAKPFENGDQPQILIGSRRDKDKVLLTVRDNGTGIEREHLDKIFDPFFTTKDVGQGMGLGLSICHRIVQECDGRIAVRTEPGKFCEFTLEFAVKGTEPVTT